MQSRKAARSRPTAITGNSYNRGRLCGSASVSASTSLVLVLATVYMLIILYFMKTHESAKLAMAPDSSTSALNIDTLLAPVPSLTPIVYAHVPDPFSTLAPSPAPEHTAPKSTVVIRRVGFVDGAPPVFNTTGIDLSLALYIKDISFRPECADKPVFMTMAKVRTLLYWDLIENFFGTMDKFSLSDCALMVCISDEKCMTLCEAHGFSCFDYRHSTASSSSSKASTMEMVATVKLLHVGIALEMGAHILLIDLDVGFLRDPLLLCNGFFGNPLEHVRSQMDVGYSHYKHNNELYTHPRPNFGVFLVKSHKMAVMAFRRAWQTYLKSTPDKKNRVATDQNALAVAMKWARWRWDFNFSYFHLGLDLVTKPRPILPQTMVLLDKIDDIAMRGIHFELGGDLARKELKEAVGVHATCYEGATKLFALKAVNAFWTKGYHNPSRRTITKPILLVSPPKLRDELASLAYLASRTNRSMIIPNIFLGFDKYISRTEHCSQGMRRKGARSFLCRHALNERVSVQHAGSQDGGYYWPSFRAVASTVPDLETIEPAYYYKILMDYKVQVPDPYVYIKDVNTLVAGSEKFKLEQILNEIRSVESERLVLGLYDSQFDNSDVKPSLASSTWLMKWAASGTSSWGKDRFDLNLYAALPTPNRDGQDHAVSDYIHLCKTFLYEVQRNGSCFNKCKAPNLVGSQAE